MAIDFKGNLYPKNVILYAVFFYVRHAVSALSGCSVGRRPRTAPRSGSHFSRIVVPQAECVSPELAVVCCGKAVSFWTTSPAPARTRAWHSAAPIPCGFSRVVATVSAISVSSVLP